MLLYYYCIDVKCQPILVAMECSDCQNKITHIQYYISMKSINQPAPAHITSLPPRYEYKLGIQYIV